MIYDKYRCKFDKTLIRMKCKYPKNIDKKRVEKAQFELEPSINVTRNDEEGHTRTSTSSRKQLKTTP